MDLLLLSIFTRNRYSNTKDSFTLEYLCQPARMAHYVRYGTKHGISCVLWQVIVRFISIDLNFKTSAFWVSNGFAECLSINFKSKCNLIECYFNIHQIRLPNQIRHRASVNCCIYILCIIYISEMQSRSYYSDTPPSVKIIFVRALKSPFNLDIHLHQHHKIWFLLID